MYTREFFDYTRRMSAESAGIVVPIVIGLVNPASVCDLGCGEGIWLAAYRANGVRKILGFDGAHVDTARLAIAGEDFVAADLSQSLLQAPGRFALAQSLEVAEHLPARRAASFVDDLCHLSDAVLFSAAPPGQGGLGHVNEQPYDYWRAHFRRNGYAAFDPVRPMIAGRSEVAEWYRNNILLYLREAAVPNLCRALHRSRVDEGAAIPDISPAHYRMRKLAVSALPYAVTQRIARLKSR